ncbi:MAG: carbohydrate transporter permease [candidate division NC10 bacterium]|nr:carbohydrate transporter permease [candidate division NC10 bacterium]
MRSHGIRRFLVEDGIRHLILAPLAFLIVFPIVWMVLTSLKPSAETILWPPKMLPQVPTLQNYYEVFVRWPFLRFFLNSVLVSGVSTAAILLTSSSAGYAFAKIKSRWLGIIFFVFIATIIVPFESYMIPVYLLVNRLGWLDSYPGLILPFIIMAFGVFFMRQTIQAIPDELIQAARIDGCSEFAIFWRMILPLSAGPLSALAIYAFLNVWGFFTWPLIITTTQDMYTTEIGLALFQSQFFIEYGLVAAGATVTALPLLLVFFVFQRRIITAVTLTGLKGT